MIAHSRTFPTPTAALGRRQRLRRVIARTTAAATAGAFSALVLAACATGTAADMGPISSNGKYLHIAGSAGTWETSGATRDTGCTWNLFSDPPGDVEYGFNNLDWGDYQLARGDVAVGETARVTLKSGEYFTSSGCADWQFVG